MDAAKGHGVESSRARRRSGLIPVIASLVALQVMFGMMVGSAAFSPQETSDAAVDTTPITEVAVESTPGALVEVVEPDVSAAITTPSAQVSDAAPIRETRPPASAPDTKIPTGVSPLPVEALGGSISLPAAIAVRAPEAEVLSLTLAAAPVQVFPVVGGGNFSSSFGAPRPEGRTHKGNDIFAEKMTPVVAVASGTVVWASPSPGEKCCYLKIRHDDGSETLYIHLNNDTPGTDDGLGWGLAEGIALGVSVDAGELIGYVGDSGNAEGTPSHLHFEYHPPGSEAVDPNILLHAAPVATHLGAPLPIYAATVETLPFTGWDSEELPVLALMLLVMGATVLAWSRLFAKEERSASGK